jgi:acetate kinase
MPTQNKFAVLVINSGSSSVKFTLLRIEDEKILARGGVERIGLEGTQITYTACHGKNLTASTTVANTQDAIALIVAYLVHEKHGVIENKGAVAAMGHRVVHGGQEIRTPVVIDKNVKGIIESFSRMAPLHNPPNLEGIQACESFFPGIPHVAVFDTAFHATLPEHAYLYGLPYAMYEKEGIRRYGFHGTSHQFVAKKAAEHLRRPLAELKLITCHMGNGTSITAVKNAQSMDTSMGFTPLEGTIMGTRCGSLDPAIVVHMMTDLKMQPDQIDRLLNRQSGFKGLAEIGSSDVRDVLTAMQNGNTRAATAIHVYVYQIRKYIGAYMAALNGADAIVFTAGIGENAGEIREMVCNGGNGLDKLGIILDPEKNTSVSQTNPEIQSHDSRVKILVIPTDEALEIARQTCALI